jgi:hypothetical protein
MLRSAPLTVIVLLALFPISALAHPGGLNAQGCHNDRKKAEYHCHRGGGSNGRGSSPAPVPARRGVDGGNPYYANCTQARAPGAAPIMRGEPGYRPALDRDDDGVACERG